MSRAKQRPDTEGESTARTMQDDLERVRGEVAQWTDEARGFVAKQIDERPLIVAGAAAGLGFVLGGGLSRHGLALALGLGARLAGNALQEEFAQLFDLPEDGANEK